MSRNKKSIEFARALRQSDVPAEARLWRILRNRALGGFKFRRQHPINGYVVDFACLKYKVVVEADGETHLERRRQDNRRTHALEMEGWLVLRFWNTEVYDEMEAVQEAIYQACVRRSNEGRPPHPQPLTPNPSPPAILALHGRLRCRPGERGAPGSPSPPAMLVLHGRLRCRPGERGATGFAPTPV